MHCIDKNLMYLINLFVLVFDRIGLIRSLSQIVVVYQAMTRKMAMKAI